MITATSDDWSEDGDSGSGVFDLTGRPVGLHFAGGGQAGLANTIDNVLSALGLTLNLFGCAEDCAFTRAAEGLAHGVELLELAHRLRDEILPRTARGRQYLRLYEQHSPGLVSRMVSDPELLGRTRRLLGHHRRTLSSMVNGGSGRVSRQELTVLDRLLGDYASDASPGLREALKRLRRDIRDPDVQADFGIQVDGVREP